MRLQKKQFEFILFIFDSQMPCDFCKKKVIKVGGLATLTKKGLDSPHLLFD